ncbi:MAG: hypothetical protein Q7R85_03855 [bacterium]|nr:hypothetical protein [bacterium]
MRAALKIFFILALVVVVLGGGYLIYRYIFKGTLPLAQSPVAQAPATTTQTQQAQGVKLFSQQLIFDYWVNTKTNAVYIVTPEGKIIKTFGDGREEVVSSQTLGGLHRVDPAPDGMRALVQFSYPSSDIFAVFDTETKSWERLPAGTVMATLDPTGQKIAYVRRNNGVSSLFILSLADKKTVEVLRLAVVDGLLSWKGADEITVLPIPEARFSANALTVNIAKKSVRKVNLGAMFLQNTNGSLGLKLLPPNGSPAELRVVRANDGFERQLTFITIPSKCGFDGVAALYCGVPIEFPSRSVIPDDYLKESFFSRDALIKYSFATGDEEELIDPALQTVDIDHPTVKGKQLLFKNRYDEKLYALELPVEAKKQ